MTKHLTDSSPATLDITVESGVCRITLDRPHALNALDPTMLDELLDALHSVRRSRDVRVVVLTGRGRAFCAGVDLRGPFFMEGVESDSVFEGARLLDWQHEMITAVHELPQPTVAVVNGDAVGGAGFGLAMACDMRFAVSSARFWMIPGQVNVIQDFGLTWLLQRAVGQALTMELVYSGRRVDGREAHRMGIVNEVFDNLDAAQEHADAVAKAVAGMGGDSGRMLKLIVRHGAGSSLREQLRIEAVANSLCFTSEEFTSAKTALLDRINR